MEDVLKAPKVTFLVPCYNYGNYLQTCVDSITSQTYRNTEILILDDGSTDNTEIVAETLVSGDERIRYFRNQTNLGHLANYNRGIQMAKGELIWLISADDALATPDVLGDFVRAFEMHPNLGYAFCRVQIIDEYSHPHDQFIPRTDDAGLATQPSIYPGLGFFRHLIKANFVPAPAVLARKSCYDVHGLFHPDLTHSGDWYNWLLFCLTHDVYYQPAIKVYYRKHRVNMHRTYQKPRHAVDNTLLCYEEIEARLKEQRAPRSLRWLTRQAKIRFKKQHGLSLSPLEKVARISGKFTRQLIH